MKKEFKLHDSIGELIDGLVTNYDAGQVDSIMVCYVKGDNLITDWANMTSLERLGAVEVLKNDFLKHLKAETDI